MARKFLYVIAFCVLLYIGGRLALQFYPETFSRLAFEPRGEFKAQPPLAANAYADPAMWISRPGLGAGDPAQWRPDSLAEDADAPGAAVFFIHPTSYLSSSAWNGPLDDADARKFADRLVKAIATPFNRAQSVWVPRYRQAAFGAFLSEKPEAARALDLAYGDVARAFDVFLAEVPPQTPIVLAGHSQGAYHLRRLMAQRVAGQPLARRVVAAYAIGWPVSISHDLPKMGLPACTAPDQTGCVLSWLSFAEPAEPGMVIRAYERGQSLDGQSLKGSAFLCTNPLTGKAGGSAPASANLGALVPDGTANSGKIVPALVPAACAADGTLRIGSPPEMGEFVLPGNNYHVYDVPLFWTNVRADVERRMRAWKP